MKRFKNRNFRASPILTLSCSLRVGIWNDKEVAFSNDEERQSEFFSKDGGQTELFKALEKLNIKKVPSMWTRVIKICKSVIFEAWEKIKLSKASAFGPIHSQNSIVPNIDEEDKRDSSNYNSSGERKTPWLIKAEPQFYFQL